MSIPYAQTGRTTKAAKRGPSANETIELLLAKNHALGACRLGASGSAVQESHMKFRRSSGITKWQNPWHLPIERTWLLLSAESGNELD